MLFDDLPRIGSTHIKSGGLGRTAWTKMSLEGLEGLSKKLAADLRDNIRMLVSQRTITGRRTSCG